MGSSKMISGAAGALAGSGAAGAVEDHRQRNPTVPRAVFRRGCGVN
ncbi:hypothetical protein [Pseudarthrobacter sulfonivorans]|nr:hypothetical protein [Pseudarthrobacter sulfonivorans]